MKSHNLDSQCIACLSNLMAVNLLRKPFYIHSWHTIIFISLDHCAMVGLNAFFSVEHLLYESVWLGKKLQIVGMIGWVNTKLERLMDCCGQCDQGGHNINFALLGAAAKTYWKMSVPFCSVCPRVHLNSTSTQHYLLNTIFCISWFLVCFYLESYQLGHWLACHFQSFVVFVQVQKS